MDKAETTQKMETSHSEGRNLILLNLGLLLAVAYLHNWLPEPLGYEAPQEVFSAGRAMSHLMSMLDLGVRTVGSRSNEVMVPQYLIQQLKEIERGADHSITFEVEMQWPSGGFTTPFLGTFVNTYDRVTNVILRLSPKNIPDDSPALLVSAHYDSALGTVGASDDLLNIAAMLEVVRTLTQNPLKNRIIFNFNGAEETNWQAAHGFITQHKWARHITAMVNLEASGAGGREMVIQNGPANAWISRAYADNVPHPHIHGVAQLIFQSGILPAQTDFQTYRDNHPTMKQLPGMDLAVVSGGHVYHTPQDNIDHVEAGHVQRLGENVLALVKAMSESERLRDPGDLKDAHDTTFDVLGMFVVRYSSMVGEVLNVLALLTSTYIIYETKTYDLGKTALRQAVLPAFGLAILTPLTVATLFTLLNQNISWYSNTWVAYILYTLPSIVVVGVVYHRFGEKVEKKQPVKVTQTAVITGCTMFWMGLLLPLTLLQHTLTTFMFLAWFLPIIVKYVAGKAGVTYSGVMHFASCTPGLVLWWHLYLTVIGFFLPLMGRIGNVIPPNVFVAAISGPMVGVLLLMPVAAIFRVPTSGLKVGLRFAAAMFTVGVTASICFLPIYTSQRPKRLFMQHVRRTWHDAQGTPIKHDSGLWINPMDFNGLTALRREWPALENTIDAKCKEGSLYCDYPWYFPVSEMIGGGKWMEADPPKVPDMELTASSTATTSGRKVTVKIRGPRQMTFIISQGKGMPKVVGWSLADRVLPPREDCDCHFVFHSKGAPANLTTPEDLRHHTHEGGKTGLRYNYQAFDTIVSWDFDIELEGSGTLDVAAYGHYLDHPLSAELQEHHESLPEWASDLAWVSAWGMFKI